MATAPAKHATAKEMTRAAASFLESLSDTAKAQTVYQYEDGERVFWYYPPLNRHGIALRDLDTDQRGLAFSLMGSGLTERSFKQAKQIIEPDAVAANHDEICRPQLLPQ